MAIYPIRVVLKGRHHFVHRPTQEKARTITSELKFRMYFKL